MKYLKALSVISIMMLQYQIVCAADATSEQQLQLQQIQRLQTMAQNQTAPTSNQQPAALNNPQQQTATAQIASIPNMVAPAPTVTSPVPGGANQIPTQQMVTTTDDQMREGAFQQVTKNLLPMSPEQIQTLHRALTANQYAVETNPETPPRPVASSKVVNLAPGATPPVIRLSQGFVSSHVFVDSTGAPWPIKSYDLGNPSAFNIQWDKKSNTLMVQATKMYTYGNLAVQLEGLSTPVMITLVPGQKAIDYRADLRVQGFGPNAKSLPTGDGLPSSANPVLLAVLDGVPPEGSKPQQVVGGTAQAWSKENKLYLRTRMTLLSPSWISSMVSADGTKAYELQNAPTLLVSDNGKVVQVTVKNMDE